ncbi:hypothetical protein HGRIS_011385 [Hohenbuehelia grisea]|uniref:PH domain-containing protein n=1 Tax=Hohenbuehelia grisea TaxID=104357 RepID=A0ABR3JUX0_9AGAR
MEEPPYVQSPVGGPRSAGIQLRASKFLQKVSHIRGRIRFPIGRKTTDDRGMPYLRQTRSMDTGIMAKPYMSQPVLGLRNIERDHAHHASDENSSQSASPSGSPSRGHMRKLPTMPSIGGQAAPLRSVTATHTSGAGRSMSIDGLPITGTSDNHLYVTSITLPPGAAAPHPPPIRNQSDYVPRLEIPTPPVQRTLAPPATNASKRPRSAGGRSTPSQAGTQPTKGLTPRQSKAKLRAQESTPSHAPGAQALVPGPSTSSATPRTSPLQIHNMPTGSFRFSANGHGSAEGMARLSPTIIARHPPLPILNLPKLVVSGAPDSPSSPLSGSLLSRNGRRRRAPLSSMPALPLRGQDQPRDGDDDDDDGPEDDEDDEEDDEAFHDAEDMQQDEDGDEDDHLPRPSMDSYISNSSSSSFLPEVDTSRIDLSFLDEPQVTTKTKGKHRAQNADVSRTPTQTGTHGDYFSSSWEAQTPVATASSPLRTPRLGETPRTPLFGMSAALSSGLSIGLGVGLGAAGARPPMYKHVSRSMVDMLSMGSREETEAVDDQIGANGMRRRSQRKSKARPGDDLVPGSPPRPSTGTPGEPLAGAQRPLSIHRRRSMPTFTAQTEPPPYPAFPPHPHLHRHSKDEPEIPEGKENLPAYSNAIYIKAIMPRKMEFTKPGEQARDRKWRRVVCELEGTVFRVYRCPPNVAGVGVISGWWERKVGVGDVATDPAASAASGSSASRARGSDTRDFVPISKVADEPLSPQQRTAQIILPPPRPTPPAQSSPPAQAQHHQGAEASSEGQPPAQSRSRLVGLLKAHARPHSRSQSDVNGMLSPGAGPGRLSRPRSSLSIPRPSTSTGSPSGSSSNVSGMDSSSHGSFASSLVSPPSSASSAALSQSSASTSPAEASGSTLFSASAIPNLGPSEMVRAYTMQHAESGLGNDYTKRKNVIRVRMEGEQFLLQAKDMADVVAWIEVRGFDTLQQRRH